MTDQSTMESPRPLLNTPGLARALNVSAKTVRKLRREGRIPVVRAGAHSVRFKLEDVLEALAEEPKGGDA